MGAKDDEAAKQLLEEKLAEARGYRATFQQCVERGRAAGTVDETFVSRVEARFDALEKLFVVEAPEEVLDNLVERAEELEQLRAYVMPANEIPVEARMRLIDLRDWLVPSTVLRAIDAELMPAIDSSDLQAKRSALHKIFELYDYWWVHTDGYFEDLKRIRAWLLVVSSIAVGITIASLSLGWGLAAFACGGLLGSMVSVFSRLPTVAGWGQWMNLGTRIVTRIALGMAGTIAAGGLLTIGALSIGKERGDFAQIIETSHRASTADGLYLLAVGILMGFTERILLRLSQTFVDPERKADRAPQRPSASTPPASAPVAAPTRVPAASATTPS